MTPTIVTLTRNCWRRKRTAMNLNSPIFAPGDCDGDCESRGLVYREGAKSVDFCTSIEFCTARLNSPANMPTLLARCGHGTQCWQLKMGKLRRLVGWHQKFRSCRSCRDDTPPTTPSLPNSVGGLPFPPRVSFRWSFVVLCHASRSSPELLLLASRSVL